MQSAIPMIQMAPILKVFHAGRKQIEQETQEWERMTVIVAMSLVPKEGLA
jgi:hypothetical protein